MAVRTYSHADWKAEAVRRFGDHPMRWRFVCPSCGHVASVADWKAAGAPDGAVAFSCVGRYTGSTKEIFDKTGGPCNYTGGGFFGLNPVRVELDGQAHSVFDFADSEAGHVA